jgi:hypothetical protein
LTKLVAVECELLDCSVILTVVVAFESTPVMPAVACRTILDEVMSADFTTDSS